MNIYPKNLAEQVDFNIILDKLASHCYSNSARQLANELKPSSSFEFIELQLIETSELLLAIHKGDVLNATNFPDIDKELQLLSIENSVLSTTQMVNIRKVVIITNQLIRFFSDKEIIYPQLKKRCDDLEEDKFMVDSINEIIAGTNLVVRRKN